MNDGLLEFLKDHEEQEHIWLLLPSGLISGKLKQNPEWKDRDRVTLVDALISGRMTTVEVEEATILISQIHAWGDGVPADLYDDYVIP